MRYAGMDHIANFVPPIYGLPCLSIQVTDVTGQG